MLAMNSVRDTWADGINRVELLCVLSQTYEDFALVPPEEYDYAKHVGPWYRYCGARYVSAQGGGTASGQCIPSLLVAARQVVGVVGPGACARCANRTTFRNST